MRKSQHKTRILLATWGVAMAALLAPAPAAQAQNFTMKLSTATINDTQHEWLKRFGAEIEKNSGGRIKPEIYPASQLGSIPRQIEGVQFGSIQGWMGPPEFLVGVDERFESPSAPGLFSSVDQVMKVFQDPPVIDCDPPISWLTSGEKMLIEPPKVATPSWLASPGPRSTTTAPTVEDGKNEVEWCVGPLASPQGMPSSRPVNSSD